MPTYRWSAASIGGDVVHGIMDAPDQETVVERLQLQGRIVLRADPVHRWAGRLALLRVELGGRRPLNKPELAEVTRELATILAAGQDLDRALRFVVENTGSTRAREILERVRDKIRGGSSLAAALAAEPQSFS